MKKIILLGCAALFIEQGCGVRGDPIPPQSPAQLGRGEPTYQGATQNLAFPSVPPVYAPKAKDNKDDQNEKK